MLGFDVLLRPSDDRRYGLRLDTFIRLRWLVVIGQTITLLAVRWGLGFDFPLAPTLGIVAVSAATNLGLRLRYPRPHFLVDSAAGFLLAFDIIELAGLLYFTGGLDNPFFAFFLAPFLISATALTPRTTLLLGLLIIIAVTVLTLSYIPLPWAVPGGLTFPLLYRISEWVAMAVQVGFIGIYTWKIADETRQLSDALAATELALEREQHLSALDGLAAAAAHELGTPLATIALVVRELERAMPADSPYADDVRLLRDQSERCRVILRRIASLGSGDAPFDRLSMTQLVNEVAEPHRNFGIDIILDLPKDRQGEPVIARNPGILHGLGNIVENAVDFAKHTVTIRTEWTGDEVEIVVTDDGPGFADDIINEIGNPYVSWRGKKSGKTPQGLGLGIFIAKTLLERSGATISMKNRPVPEQGAIVRVLWPRAKLALKPQQAGAANAPESGIQGSLAGEPAAE
ncbi:MAG TPA: ActS/PrrB/RegB family redox-sensitive histidine kinase [Xanthobacteraceae bacterium]|nr:ActS/PrrB/RegB family redox-sensitive histidine kinase [Xanthobacteraceae bacterium]